jgi:hypothetical protein
VIPRSFLKKILKGNYMDPMSFAFPTLPYTETSSPKSWMISSELSTSTQINAVVWLRGQIQYRKRETNEIVFENRAEGICMNCVKEIMKRQ